MVTMATNNPMGTVQTALTLFHPLTPYGVIMVNTRRYTLVHDFCFFSYGRERVNSLGPRADISVMVLAAGSISCSRGCG